MKKKYRSEIMILLLSVLLSLCSYPFLPDKIPMHWNAQGIVDAYYSKISIFFLPILILGLMFLFYAVRFTDPKKENYKKFEAVFNMIKLTVYLLIFSLQIITIVSGFNEHLIDVPLILNMGLGILFAVLGNTMPKVRPNYFIGIKTPWALADEDNWRITHRFAGKLWFIGGLLMLPSAFLPAPLSLHVVLVIVIGLCVISYAYSYYVFRKKEKEEKTYDRN